MDDRQGWRRVVHFSAIFNKHEKFVVFPIGAVHLGRSCPWLFAPFLALLFAVKHGFDCMPASLYLFFREPFQQILQLLHCQVIGVSIPVLGTAVVPKARVFPVKLNQRYGFVFGPGIFFRLQTLDYFLLKKLHVFVELPVGDIASMLLFLLDFSGHRCP